MGQRSGTCLGQERLRKLRRNKILELSPFAKEAKPSATLAINERIVKKRAAGEKILHMGFGESPFPVHPNVRKALCDNSDKKSYLPTQGILPLRERISSFYQKMFKLEYLPDQICVGPGSKILLFAALAALDGPLLLPAPSWVSYQHQSRLLQKEVVAVETSVENSYRVTPESFEDAIQETSTYPSKQKLLLLNYPCNPTGHSFSASQLKELAAVARDYNVIILSDEIYGLTSYTEQEHHSIAEYYPEGTLVFGGLSKDRSLGGYRVGVVLLPEGQDELLRTMVSIGSETWSCVVAPIQYAAIEAYKANAEIINYIKDCAMIHEIVTKYAHHRLMDSGIRCPPPQGAFYLFPDWNEYRETLTGKSIDTSDELSNVLIDFWNVACLPGSEFGMPIDYLCVRLAIVDYNGETALNTFQEDHKGAIVNPELFIKKVAPRIVETCDQLEKFTETYST